MSTGTTPRAWPAAWVIRSDRERCPETGWHLYWSNRDGWVDLSIADTFTYPERCALDLPLGGIWVVASTIETGGPPMNPWRIDELMRDRRQYAQIGSRDPMVAETAARQLNAWKMDCAEALGWRPGDIALAHLDAWATWGKRLADAWATMEREATR